MPSLLLLIPLGLGLLGVAIWAFFWAVDHGQFDDLDTPAARILEDECAPPVATIRAHPTESPATPDSPGPTASVSCGDLGAAANAGEQRITEAAPCRQLRKLPSPDPLPAPRTRPYTAHGV